jgi:hypothetical protein
MLFAWALDPFLKQMKADIDDRQLAVTRACAGDIGAAIRRTEALLRYRTVSVEAKAVVGLSLKPAKCVIVPMTGKFKLHLVLLIKEWLDTSSGVEWLSHRADGQVLGLLDRARCAKLKFPCNIAVSPLQPAMAIPQHSAHECHVVRTLHSW